jgi:hypothetical protein
MKPKAWLVLLVPPLVFAVAHVPNPRRIRLALPTVFGLERITPRLFVDRAMAVSERARLLTALEVARARVAAFWGDAPGEPSICACSTAECYRRFGGGRDRGQTNFGHLLLSPRGLDAVVIAHEWTHAELSRRAPLLATVPAWFSEGLAVVASDDPLYGEDLFQTASVQGLPAPSLAEMETLRQFLDVPRGYLTASHEVRRWLSIVGRPGLLALVGAMRDGEEFHHAYRRLERAAGGSAGISIRRSAACASPPSPPACLAPCASFSGDARSSSSAAPPAPPS